MRKRALDVDCLEWKVLKGEHFQSSESFEWVNIIEISLEWRIFEGKVWKFCHKISEN
jgi:hypothetical protein